MLQSQMENTLFDDAKHIVQIHTVEVTNLHSFAIIPYITQCLLLRMSNKTGPLYQDSNDHCWLQTVHEELTMKKSLLGNVLAVRWLASARENVQVHMIQ